MNNEDFITHLLIYHLSFALWTGTVFALNLVILTKTLNDYHGLKPVSYYYYCQNQIG